MPPLFWGPPEAATAEAEAEEAVTESAGSVTAEAETVIPEDKTVTKDEENVMPEDKKGADKRLEVYDILEAATAGMQGIQAICTADAILCLWNWESKEDLLKARASIDYLLRKMEAETDMARLLRELEG